MLPFAVRTFALFSALVAAAATACAPAAAQSSADTGIIAIDVVDASSKAAVGDARVTLLGATTASALTTHSGIVRYTDVPSGLYRVRVAKSGFAPSISAQFEVLGNKEIDVDVRLGPNSAAARGEATTTTSDGNLKVIGRVSARVTIETKDVDENSAIRKISDSLTDALGKIAGVDVTQDSNDPNAPQTISLRGKDESQTAVTLDGIPLSAPGSATNLRAINTDLFAGAGVNFGPSAGSLGGSVNFRTLQPTQTWQSRFATSYGTYDRFTYQLGETGSFGKLGVAVLHTYRAANNPLTFQTYTDSSGLTYPHAGESTNVGDFLKLRYALNERFTLNLTGLQNNSGTSLLCTQDVTITPCGSGPGNTSGGHFGFAYASVQGLIGEVSTSVTGYVSSNRQSLDEAQRYVAGAPDPLVTTTDALSRGIAFATTATQGKHTLTLSGSTFAGTTAYTPLLTTSAFVRGSVSGTASSSYQFSDSFKVNDRLTLGENASIASTNGSGSSFVGGINGAWRPGAADQYSAAVSVGSSQPAGSLARTFSDPASARFNCAAGTAAVTGPGDEPGKQSALDYDTSWTHAAGNVQFTLDLYRQRQAGQLVNAQIDAASLGFAPGDPYIAALEGVYRTPDVCGASAVLTPAGVYVTEPIGATTRVYSGFSFSGRIGVNRNLGLYPSYTTTSARVTATDARLLGLESTTILGAQIPGRPVHRGNLTLDALFPGLQTELLANASYTGSNNAQHLDPYVLVNAGLSHALGAGRLTLFAANLFNTEAGALSSLAYAQPIPLSGGGQLLQAANPNAPRSYTLTYSFNTGANRGAGFARAARGPAGVATVTPAPAGSPAPRARGLGAFTPFPPPAGVDPLSVATARPSCRPEDAPVVAPILAQLATAADAYAAGRPVPDVANLTITPHGDPKGRWYFELRPKLPAGFAFGPRRDGAPGGGPPPGGPPPEGEGGGPQRVVVAPPAPRPEGAAPEIPPEARAALQRFRTVLGCAYFSAFSQTEASVKGYTAFTGRNALGYAPGIGLFAVRPPELGTGGGSVKQTK